MSKKPKYIASSDLNLC